MGTVDIRLWNRPGIGSLLRRPHRMVLTMLACGLTAILLITPPTAEAHTKLVSSSPEADSQVSAPISQVRLTFSSPVSDTFAVITLSVDGAQPRSLTTAIQGREVTASFPAGTTTPGFGRWTIAYRVVSGDGHPINDELAFTVAATRPGPATDSPAVTSASERGKATASSTGAAPQFAPSQAPAHGGYNGQRWFAPSLAAVSILIAALIAIVGPRLARRSRLSADDAADSGTTATDPATPDPATPDPATPDPATPDPATPDPATPDPPEFEPATADPPEPDRPEPGPVTPGDS
ncbi:MAG TPA: copper resistance CopC family protein [Microlunatus sp.]